MVSKIFSKGRDLFYSSQNSVLSAASIIMVMIVASRLLGLVRQRILANFFDPNELSLFFAAFRLPDLIFEVLVFGTFSSAFIPVFARAVKRSSSEAWDIAGRVLNIGLLLFIPFAVLISLGIYRIYRAMLPGFSDREVSEVAKIAKILFFCPGFFCYELCINRSTRILKTFFNSRSCSDFL